LVHETPDVAFFLSATRRVKLPGLHVGATRCYLFDHLRRLLCRCNRKCQPGIPARRPILSRKFPIPPQAQGTLHFPDGKQHPSLGPNGGDARQVRTKRCPRAAISSELIKIVANSTDEEVLVQESRGFQVRMPIDSVLIIGVRVPEKIGGKPPEFAANLNRNRTAMAALYSSVRVNCRSAS
jgi:hypothetical protein